MKVGIMQPYFVPYIGYWQLINVVDKFIIYDDVNFIKGGWINRNRILMNEEAKMINVQMQGASSNKLINQIGVSDNKIVKSKLLKSIENSYKKAPYYTNSFPIIKSIIMNKENNLSKYLAEGIIEICRYLEIDTEIIISSTLNKNNELRGQDKVIEICKLFNADGYVNAIGGKELYNYDDFTLEGLNLEFLNTGDIEYKQFENKFIPHLSIIDVIMFNSVEEIKAMLDRYILN